MRKRENLICISLPAGRSVFLELIVKKLEEEDEKERFYI